jgi:Rps23 Pro-64 3,4-dihydroxylase Tpa1-like proline 4-hydroxylase
MPYLAEMDPRTGYVCADTRDRGSELAEVYQNNSPFPHIVIDDFLPPDILEMCLAQFPSQLSGEDVQFNRDQERYKSQFHPDTLAPPLRALFYSFNSKPFIRVLENISGIKGLIPDPYFLGAGFHEIGQGGHLSVHVDFNHHKPMNLERRINLLIYLNKDWRPEYGGQLELWNTDMTERKQSIVPMFNRCAMFSTTETSYHGNPEPINHPLGVTRKSIALYYYTSTWTGAKREHTTQFKVRHGTADKTDLIVKNRELLVDLMPPIVLRNARLLRQRLSRRPAA